jgi:hypothetical protein
MIDTIKLNIDLSPQEFAVALRQSGAYDTSYGYTRIRIKPPPQKGRYFPRAILHSRSNGPSKSYMLVVEFSAPKLLFGNNFDEVSEDDLLPTITALQKRLRELLGLRFTKYRLLTARVSAIHYSKNVVFDDYTSTLTVLNTLSRQDIPSGLDIQLTNFRTGHALHIHSNSLDIVFYDKLEDMKRALISPQRSIEPGTRSRPSKVKKLRRPLEIFRFEVRLTDRRRIRQTFKGQEAYDMANLYSEALARRILLDYWSKFTHSIDLLKVDQARPYNLFKNIVLEDTNIRLKEALARTAACLIVDEVGFREFRGICERISTRGMWYRFKPKIRTPQPGSYRAFNIIRKELEELSPTRLCDLTF